MFTDMSAALNTGSQTDFFSPSQSLNARLPSQAIDAECRVDHPLPHPYARFVNPHLSQLLQTLKLDKEYVQGQGCQLFDRRGRVYLDCISAYGALPFGFNPEEIWSALLQVRAKSEPSLVQPSMLDAAGELAQRLIELAPGDLQYVTFANSGAEAIEAALKMCRIATGRSLIVSTHNSFHGKTLGALAATGNEAYQAGFATPVDQCVYVPFGDLDALKTLLSERRKEIAAVILEPVQGEGGIVVPPDGYLRGVRALCDRYNILLIFDEIQSGLGRTGDLFACDSEQVAPDVMTLAKALGGGLMPLGAVLANAKAYSEAFALKHSSTFAGNTLACRAGLAALECLTRNHRELLDQVRENGTRLKAGLKQLAERYPHVICDVRGRGYMLGLVFGVVRNTWPESLLSIAAEQSLFTPIFASYLLNVEGIRVAPTLNGKAVVRIEPALTFSWNECQRLLQGLERALKAFETGHTGQIFSSILAERAITLSPAETQSIDPRGTCPQRGERRFAFLLHPLDLHSVAQFDPALAMTSESVLKEISERVPQVVSPFVLSTGRVQSPTGETAYGEFIVVPQTAEQLAAMPRSAATATVQAAVDLARERGAQMIGLGAFTSVVTGGGRLLDSGPIAMTTGNCFTAVACVQSIRKALIELDTELGQDTSVAVVGATGAIGRAMALLLSENVGRMVLIGNPDSHRDQVRKRLLDVAQSIGAHLQSLANKGRRFTPGTLAHRWLGLHQQQLKANAEASNPNAVVEQLEAKDYLVLTQDLNEVPTCDVVVTATSATNALLTSDDLRTGAVVCDMSRPWNVSREIAKERSDVLVIDGGLISVPGSPELGRIGLDRGHAFSCMAETMMLTLAGHFESTGIGTDLNVESLQLVKQLAQEHGFEIAQLKSFGKPLDEQAYERVKAGRSQWKWVA